MNEEDLAMARQIVAEQDSSPSPLRKVKNLAEIHEQRKLFR